MQAVEHSPPPHCHSRFDSWRTRFHALLTFSGSCAITLFLAACGGGENGDHVSASSNLAEGEALSAKALATRPAENWDQIAVQGGSFFITGTARVRYRDSTGYSSIRTISGAGQCTDAFFSIGSPAVLPRICEQLRAVAGVAFVDSGPLDKVVAAGQTTIFAIQATLSQSNETMRYQWFKDSVPIAGATGPTVTVPSSAADIGVTYEIKVNFGSSNSGSTVSASGLLTVAAGPLPPNLILIERPPGNQTVPAGQTALFSVGAKALPPGATLRYQWFKNSLPIASATGPDVLVPTNPADAGSSSQISVKIGQSNSRGLSTVNAILSVVAAPPSAGGTLITAAEGGTVAGGSTGEEASLYVAPGALSANTTILLTTEPLAPSSLPAGVTAMSDIVEIKPAGLAFLKPASLSFLMKQNVPSDTGLVVVRLDANNNVLGQQARRVGVASAKAMPNMKALSVNGRATASAATLPGGLDCVSAQFVDGASKLTSSAITASGRLAVLAVPTAQCASIAVPASGSVPLDTNQACTSEGQFGGIGLQQPPGLNNDRESSLVNRHVDCRMTTTFSEPNLYVDMLVDFDGQTRTFAPISADPNATLTVGAGKVKLEFQLSTFGPSGVLGKTLSYRARVVEFVPESPANYLGPAITAIYLRPTPECTAQGFSFFSAPASATCEFTSIPIEVTTQRADLAKPYAWSKWGDMPVRFDWVNQSTSGSSYDIAVFRIKMDQFQIRVKGTDEQFRRPGNAAPYETNAGLGYVPDLRCDKNLAQVKTKGCVFHEAAAVYVLERKTENGEDSSVKEAAEHILEAQTYADESKRAPGRFVLKAGTRAFADTLSTSPLQRAKSRTVQDANRDKVCSLTNGFLYTRPPLNQSPKCATGEQVCSCDEYPFASTWNGGNFRPERTSAKKINLKQNEAAGTGNLTNFYRSQRVLDFTLYPEQVQPYDPNAESNRGGDDFWVFIK